MNPILEDILRTNEIRTASGEVVKLHSGVSRSQGEFLRDLVTDLQPKATLEIGLAYGVSALFICEALGKIPGARHMIVDPAQFSEQLWKGAGLANLNAAGYGDLIEFHELPSHIALPRTESEGRRIDFAFIDGCHLYDYVLSDFFCVDKLLKVGGVVAFDDLWMPAIQQVCRFILTNRAYSVYRCFPNAPPKPKPLARRMIRSVRRSIKSLNGSSAATAAQAEIDRRLGLPNQCIAFRKEAEDDRIWDFHRNF